ncbi:MAG TPA: glycosyltransferase family 39 protein [Allosphingosinicella sp.]|jgi:dolichyl-phosphate-mannose--protein O-mannosyl transferase
MSDVELSELSPSRIAGLRVPPALALLLLCAATQFLFAIGLQHPLQPFFDETHYVPAARALIGGEDYLNVEHPLAAKYLIGLSMLLFGDTPFGWRMLGTFMGTATVAAVFLIAQALFRDTRLSLMAGLLTALNQLVFIQARLAMLDVYMGAFLLFALFLLIDSHGRAGARVRIELALAGILLGLALGCKWAAAPYLGLAGLAFAALRVRAALEQRAGAGGLILSRSLAPWRGVSTLEGGAYLGLLSLVVYLATFLPALFVEHHALTTGEILPHQLEIYRLQTQPLAAHTYMSQWPDWPLIGRPIWYLYERVGGVLRGVLLVGNPAIMWGGLIAVAACLIGGLRARDPRLLLVAGLYLFSYGIWAVIPKKIGFYYYYYLPAILLSLALVGAFGHYCRAGRLRWLPPAFVAASAALFVYFYPIIAARPLSHDQDFNRWMWFDSWR